MKIVKITLVSAVGILLALLGLGALLDEGGTASEKIERECKRTYGDRGERAVLDCQLAMSVRYMRDAEKGRSDATYGRIR